MAIKWKQHPKKVLKGWISALDNSAVKQMSLWERHFVASLDWQLEKHDGVCSEKQQEILERLYTTYTK